MAVKKSSFFAPSRNIRAPPRPARRVLQPHFPRAPMLPPPTAPPEHLNGQQPPANAACADLLQGQIPHLQVPQHGGLQEEPGGAGETPEAHWI